MYTIKKIHIGHEIAERIKQLRITKTEFARRMSMPQQNVNRILDSEHITTDKLLVICSILDYDFFSLYVDGSRDVNVVANGHSSIAALNSEVQTTDCAVLQERVRNLEQILMEKERLIQFLIKDAKNDIQS